MSIWKERIHTYGYQQIEAGYTRPPVPRTN